MPENPSAAYVFGGSSTPRKEASLYIVGETGDADAGGETPETGHETGGGAHAVGGEESQTKIKCIGIEDVRQLVNAAKYSDYIGTPFLAMVTLRWDMVPSFDATRWMPTQTRLLKQASQWLDYRSVPVAYAWVREVSREMAPHTHVLMHLPVEHWGAFRTFVTSCGGFDPTSRIDAPVHVSGGDYGTRTRYMRAGQLRYFCKTISADATHRVGGRTVALAPALGVRPRPTGAAIAGKIVGVARCLDHGARAAAGWREVRTVAELRRALNP